jgi:hypothetical protein
LPASSSAIAVRDDQDTHHIVFPSGDYFLIALSDGADVDYHEEKVAARLARVATLVHLDLGDRLARKLEVVRAF